MFTTGVIVKGIGGFYYIKAQGELYECKARGKFRKEGIVPMVGDYVDIEIKNGKGSIENIHKRSSMLIRPAVANINQLVVVCALASPQPHPALIDSFLIMGRHSGLDTILCFNKSDLEHSEEIKKAYQDAGCHIVVTSTQTGEGVDELRELLTGKITVFAGNSGVGKSSLLNALGVSYELETGAVSQKIQRGRHTTRHVELLELEGGALVLDTPGFSSFEMPKIRAGELENYFAEFEPYLGRCKFRGCSHTSEPGCAVIDAVLKGEISKMRHESYKSLYEEQKKLKDWEL